MTSNWKQGENPVPHPEVPGRPCSVAAALQLVGERWALLAIREIFYCNQRFDQIVRNAGAPRDRLAARLRALEEAGVVEGRAYSERPLRFEYHLTEAGRDLAPVMRAAGLGRPLGGGHSAGRLPASRRARLRARPRSDVDVPDLR